jgi:hypothetical protein
MKTRSNSCTRRRRGSYAIKLRCGRTIGRFANQLANIDHHLYERFLVQIRVFAFPHEGMGAMAPAFAAKTGRAMKRAWKAFLTTTRNEAQHFGSAPE